MIRVEPILYSDVDGRVFFRRPRFSKDTCETFASHGNPSHILFQLKMTARDAIRVLAISIIIGNSDDSV